MLFGLYKKLPFALWEEWPGLRRLVVDGKMGEIHILGEDVGLGLADETTCDAKDVLKYMYEANHNMIHFACHCIRNDDDFLLLSRIECASHITDECVSGKIASEKKPNSQTVFVLTFPAIFEKMVS